MAPRAVAYIRRRASSLDRPFPARDWDGSGPHRGARVSNAVTVFVFTGPTISAADAGCVLDAVYLPPVSQGDVYRVGLEKPLAIGIVDGYFEQVPAVWHKEILWALSEGI